jgi:hypothetical protein
MPAPHQSANHVRTHAAQSNHSNLHGQSFPADADDLAIRARRQSCKPKLEARAEACRRITHGGRNIAPLDISSENENITRTEEIAMQRTDEVVARALAAVAASKALRERNDQQRREIYSRIDLASLRTPNVPKGIQLPLNLNGPRRLNS